MDNSWERSIPLYAMEWNTVQPVKHEDVRRLILRRLQVDSRMKGQ